MYSALVSTATPPRRVVLYGRASAEQDARSLSVDGQLAELRAWAGREGWTVVAEHRDDGISASRYARGKVRPGWQRVMDLIGGSQVGGAALGSGDALLVWEVSRASRDRPVVAALFAACVDADVWLGTGGKLHDLADPDDGFVVDLGAALAVREAAVIGRRRRRGGAFRAANGYAAPALPYGYRRVYDLHTGKAVGVEAHPDQAPIVAEIARRLIGGESALAVARDLNRRQVPTHTDGRWLGGRLDYIARCVPEHPVAVEIVERLGAGEPVRQITADLNERQVPLPVAPRWHSGNVTQMSVRPTYAGLRVHRGQVLDDVTGRWPVLISMADHYRLRALHEAPERDKLRHMAGEQRVSKYLLTGIARCGRQDCPGRMRVSGVGPAAAARNKRRPTYECRHCMRVARRIEPVDAMVERLVVARLSEPDIMSALAGPDDDHTVRAGTEDAARLRGKLDELEAAWGADELTLTEYKRLRDRVQPQLDDAERRARPRSVPPAVADMAGPDAGDRWKAASIASKRIVVDALVEVTILPIEGRRTRTFDPASVRVERKGASA